MSQLFSPAKIGGLEIPNRFVRSATFEGMAKEDGEVTDDVLKLYRNLAKGGIGLIVTGYLYVNQTGKAFFNQIGIHSDEMIPGLKRLVQEVHEQDGKIVFQLAHAGRQTTREVTDQRPIGPSGKGRDPIFFVKPREMTEDDINETIQSFGKAAERAVEAGADGIQLSRGSRLSDQSVPFAILQHTKRRLGRIGARPFSVFGAGAHRSQNSHSERHTSSDQTEHQRSHTS